MSSTSLGIHTKQEILSQPDVWEKTLNHLERLDTSLYPNISEYDQVVFSGCGSTFYLSRWAARACEKETGIVSRAVPSSDLLLFPDNWVHKGKKTLLVAVSRSAETTETILALKSFKAGGYGDTVVVTCYPDRELAQLSPNVIDVPEAQEESVAQTRSFSNMLLAISWLISKHIPSGLPAVFSKVGKDLIDNYRPIADRLGRDQSITKFFFLGSGSLYGLANEAMLKMKEMSLAYSESFHTLEFRHGPMSMIDPESLIITLINESAREHECTLLREMQSKGARTLGFLDQDDPKIGDALNDRVLLRSVMTELWRAPLYLPILQLIAYERAISKGLDPDRPTNLTSVVVLHG
ncbi:SIS domain-containing protein [bacterium]|nr:MAG: SIS domain-containing protein [bacterium]